MPEPAEKVLTPTDVGILYLDDHVVAVNKPSGLAVHRSREVRDSRYLLQLVRDRIGRRVYPVHRLDRATSGVMIFALSSESASRIAPHFEAGTIAKTYFAVVRGWLPDEGVIDHAFREEPGRDPSPALTAFRCVARAELPYPVKKYPQSRFSLAEITPRTGRRHQIRRHMAHIAHPLIGDTTYGRGEYNRLFREKLDSDRLLLWARSIAFPHPTDGRLLRIEARTAPEVAALLVKMGWAPA